LKTDVKQCVQDARALIQNANQLTTQAQRQLNEVEQVLQVARGWSERADRLVHQAGDIVEGPIITSTRILSVLGSLLQVWLTRNVETSRRNPSTAS